MLKFNNTSCACMPHVRLTSCAHDLPRGRSALRPRFRPAMKRLDSDLRGRDLPRRRRRRRRSTKQKKKKKKKKQEETFPRKRLAVKQRRRFRPAKKSLAVRTKTIPTCEKETQSYLKARSGPFPRDDSRAPADTRFDAECFPPADAATLVGGSGTQAS